MEKTTDITVKRELLLKSLIIYLGEDVNMLFKEFLDTESAHKEVAQEAMRIFVIREDENAPQPPVDIAIVVDGREVLNQLTSVASACALLFGLTYTLNLEFPKGLQRTFEAIQKILMELDAKSMSSKVHSLSIKLQSIN